MQIKGVTIGQALAWFGRGMRLIAGNLGVSLGIALVFLISAFMLRFIPIVGPVVWFLLAPILLSGWFRGLQHAHQGGRLEFAHLNMGFSDPQRRDLIILGVVAAAASLLIGLLPVGAMMGQGPAAGVLVGFVISILYSMAFGFAIPLVTFNSVSPLDAIQQSFYACLVNIVPLAVVWVIVGVAAVLIAVGTLGIGLLLLLLLSPLWFPVVNAMIYIAYTDIFGPSADAKTEQITPPDPTAPE